MSKIALSGNASGTGTFTLASPNSSTDRTLDLPDASGTVILSSSNIESQVKTATNASGSAPIYSCRAWVNFNGTGTVAIRASGNVSSITDNGTGDYTLNFSSALPDGNYAVAGTTMFSSSINDHFISLGDNNGAGGTLPSTTAVRFRTMYNSVANTPQDCTYVTVTVVR